MTEKELKRMSRVELVEIIAAQKKRELELEQQLKEARQALAERKLKLTRAGSIAEAALALNGVFEAAQAAADQYLQSLEAEDGAALRMAETEAECQRRLDETERACAERLAAAEEEIRQKTADFNRKIQEFLQAHPELRKMKQ